MLISFVFLRHMNVRKSGNSHEKRWCYPIFHGYIHSPKDSPTVFHGYIHSPKDSPTVICGMHIQDTKLPFHHIPKMLYWVEIW